MPLSESERPRWWDWLVALIMLLSLPFLGQAVLQVRSNTADVTRWLPGGTPERTAYDQFVEQFGTDELLVVSWQGCGLEDPRLPKFAEQLRARLNAGDSSEPLVGRVISSSELVEELTAPPLSLPIEEARRRLAGIMLGPDGNTACLVLQATERGKTLNSQLIQEVQSIAAECGIPAATLYLGGPVFEAVTIDQESLAALKTYVVPSGLLVTVLAFLFVRQVRLTLLMLLISVYCQCLSVAVIHYGGGNLDAVLIVMPTLIYVIAMSGSLHLVNYYLAACARGEAAPTTWMLRHALFPCIGASVTTAIGLGSLIVSQVEPVRNFGFYASLNILVGLVILLLGMPAGLRLSSRWSAPVPAIQPLQSLSWQSLAHWIERHRRWIIGSLLLLAIWSGMGMARLKTSLNLQQMFSQQSRLVQNYEWLETNLGPLISIEAVVHVRRDAHLDLLEQLAVVEDVEDRLRNQAHISATMSPLTFLPPLPNPKAPPTPVRRAVLHKMISNHRTSLRDQGAYADSATGQSWRVTARLPALAGLEYGQVVEGVRAETADLLQTLPPNIQKDVSVEITGITPLVYRAQDQILDDLSNSFIMAFVLICPLIIVQLRSIPAGLIAMIPNLTPVGIVFGMLGWIGIPIDIGVVLTASIGLGIAIDGTLHFVGWYLAGRARGDSHDQALTGCFETCAVAMIQTTLIVGLGLLVFGLSPFLPTMRFAVLLGLLLLVALWSDLVLMPALLSGYPGRFFSGRSTPRG